MELKKRTRRTKGGTATPSKAKATTGQSSNSKTFSTSDGGMLPVSHQRKSLRGMGPHETTLAMSLPEGIGSTRAERLLWAWVNEGWKFRQLGAKTKEERRRYAAQVQYEIDLITEKNFTHYFLVVSDLIRKIKDRGIPVGPGRGSSAASLVCYLLRITEIDPMLYDVMSFERFLDPNRSDDPDIDTDFDDDFRHIVSELAVEIYGDNRVGNIGTFTRYKAKNSLDDVARVHNIPPFVIDRIKELIPERAAGDEDTGHDIEDTLAAYPAVQEIFKKHPELHQAAEFEGNLKNFSVHAAGLVIGAEPLADSVSSYARMDNKTKTMRQVLAVDKHDAEHLGLLKLDVLGLKTMGMIRIALEQIGMTLEELYRIPLDDPKTLAAFEACDVTGIFQFEGHAAAETTAQVKPKTFMDLVAINTLARPGALHSGSTGDYIQIRHGRMERQDPHPLFAEITKDTEGQIIYQEQMMQLVRQIGGFDWAMTTKVRNNIAKSKGADSFRPMWEAFRDGAKNLHGIDESVSAEMWGRLTAAGAYAFNAAHSVAYSALGFWCMWLKVHHPIAFYVAQLRKLDPNTPAGKERIPALLQDAVAHGFEVRPPNLKLSRETWMPSKKGIVAGWTQIKGIGPAQSKAIEELREQMGQFSDWSDLQKARGIGPKKIQEILAFTAKKDPFGLDYVASSTDEIIEDIKAGRMLDCPLPDTTSKEIPYEAETSFHTVCVMLKKLIPKNLYEQHRIKNGGQELDRSTVKNPELADYCTLHTQDVSGPITISVNRNIFPKYKEELESLRPGKDFLVVQAKKLSSYGKILLAQEIWPIEIGDSE